MKPNSSAKTKSPWLTLTLTLGILCSTGNAQAGLFSDLLEPFSPRQPKECEGPVEAILRVSVSPFRAFFDLLDELESESRILGKIEKLFKADRRIEKYIGFKSDEEREQFEELFMALERDGKMPPFKGHEAPLAGKELRGLHLRHAAHAVWLEVNKKVPWSLKSYKDQDLRLLLSFESTIGSRDSGTIYQNLFRDLGQATDAPWMEFAPGSPDDYILSMSSWVSSNVSHNSGGASPKTLHHAHEGGEVGSCQHVTALMGVSAIAMNIPASVGRFPETMKTAANHHYIDFPSEGRLLTHGDIPYSRAMSETPAAEYFLNGEERRSFLSDLQKRPEVADQKMVFFSAETLARHPDHEARKASCEGQTPFFRFLSNRFGCSGQARCLTNSYPDELEERSLEYYSAIRKRAADEGTCSI